MFAQWDRPSEPLADDTVPPPYLSRVPRAHEDKQIDHDADTMIGWLTDKTPHTSWHKFTGFGQRLYVANANREIPDNTGTDHDFRLRRSPSWLKICQAQAFIPQTAEMIPGMYFTREHFQRLREDPRLQGPRGTRFGYANVPNYLDNTMFNRLVETGFTGSTGSSTELLHDQIMLSFEGHKSLVVATLHGNEMLQSKQNTEKRQQLRSA